MSIFEDQNSNDHCIEFTPYNINVDGYMEAKSKRGTNQVLEIINLGVIY